MLGIPDKGAGTTAYDRFPRVASSRSNRTKHIDDMVTSRQHGYLCMADCTLGEVRNTAYRLGPSEACRYLARLGTTQW